MSREAELTKELAEVNQKLEALENTKPNVYVTVETPKQRNVLETISHWWCPDKSAHMRVKY